MDLGSSRDRIALKPQFLRLEDSKYECGSRETIRVLNRVGMDVDRRHEGSGE